jgi:hypothetical protein
MMFDDLKHAQRQRLEYLDSLFFWEGAANRASLIGKFGISNPQAAIDFRVYLERVQSGDLSYDAKSKQYLAGESFSRLTGTPDVDELTNLIGGRADSIFDVLPDLQRSQNMRVFVPLYRALNAKRAVEIVYQSMRDPEPTTRMIYPTRFASDGVRVHVRGWCYLRQKYRDFIPARIDPDLSFKQSKPVDDVPTDAEWGTYSILTLRPHSRLTEAQQKVVRIEFGFEHEVLEVKVRKALEFYTKRRWGLEQDSPRLQLVSVRHEVIKEDIIR